MILEGRHDDLALVAWELRRAGYEPTITRTQTREEFRHALDGEWDVIISDHIVPGYSGLAALVDLQATGRDIPFILVSGRTREDFAVGPLTEGVADDYVLSEDLSRLPAAVRRALRERSVRTEQARLRQQLVLSERMATVGMLAAGIAHEVNNPLSVAIANLDIISETLESRFRSKVSSVEEPLDLEVPLRDAREALRHIRDVVRDVKLFSSPQDDAVTLVDVRRVIDSCARMASNEVRSRALLVKDYRTVPPVKGNESRLAQVVLNLLLNAAQAIPGGEADGNRLLVATRTSEDGRAVIEVADTGVGIPKENLGRIFEPFYTTKPVGQGTGLGLAISRRIVDDFGGTIEVESEVGRGTVLRVLLPAALGIRGIEAATVLPAARNGAHVLVVDDDVAVRRAIERTLCGPHDVHVAVSGAEALARIGAGERFDAIVSGLMMPDVSGIELHERLLVVAPEQAMRMIFVTGGALTPQAREFLDRVPNPRMDEPSGATKLLAVIACMTLPRAS